MRTIFAEIADDKPSTRVRAPQAIVTLARVGAGVGVGDGTGRGVATGVPDGDGEVDGLLSPPPQPDMNKQSAPTELATQSERATQCAGTRIRLMSSKNKITFIVHRI